jgi:hypothetical protein
MLRQRAGSRARTARVLGLLGVLGVIALLAPTLAGALEPRFDHRDQQGPVVEALYARDVLWGGNSTESAQRGAVRVAWGVDPSGDGNELFFGATLTVLQGSRATTDRLKLVFDTRYRACLGTEEFKTILDLGLWASAADRIAVGPLVGIGFMYDFSRNFGLFTSGFLAAGIGQNRVVSFGGGAGVQFRYE